MNFDHQQRRVSISSAMGREMAMKVERNFIDQNPWESLQSTEVPTSPVIFRKELGQRNLSWLMCGSTNSSFRLMIMGVLHALWVDKFKHKFVLKNGTRKPEKREPLQLVAITSGKFLLAAIFVTCYVVLGSYISIVGAGSNQKNNKTDQEAQIAFEQRYLTALFEFLTHGMIQSTSAGYRA